MAADQTAQKATRAVPAKAKPSAVEGPLPDSILAWDGTLKEHIAGPRDTDAFFIFNVTNISTSKITVLNVTTSCGCIAAKLPAVPWVMAPGTNGQVHVTMKLAGQNGIVMKSLVINTDRGQQLLMVRANIPIPAKP
jgi:uncharacterized protein DUF1573